ncbi:hypothetical protein TNCV_3885271 [Trichonephila clavipes]|nr:hypothetical protein TNCV_3885271 [Trichonephila clavipes]
MITTYINKYTAPIQKPKSIGKSWETLVNKDPIPRHLERAESVAYFHQIAGHEFLGVCLHWLNLNAAEVCSLCRHSRMDGDDLFRCTGLDEHPTYRVISRNWKSRRQMVKVSSTGVG